ncbi:MAG: replication initiator protein A [Pseudomonadota bacterium]
MGSAQEKTERSPLLPERHPEPDFFVCDIFDAAPKSDIASMENPLFTLSTKPDMTAREFRRGNTWLKLQPSRYGLATVHDRDILIYCISQCMAALNEGRPIKRTLRFNAHDLLKTTNRATNKKGYELFRNAMRRLQGTQVETNIMTGGEEQWEVFSFIDNAKTIKETRDGRMQAIEITLSDWVFNAINEKGKDLLTISRGYFRLRKPLERRLYEIARKMCGQSAYWHLKLETIHALTGSTSTPAEFKRMMKSIIDDNAVHAHIPDYTFELVDNLVKIRPRSSFTDIYTEAESPSAIDQVHLKGSTTEVAKKFAGGWDVYYLESEWRRMLLAKKAIPENPDGSFIGYVKWYVEKHGRA